MAINSIARQALTYIAESDLDYTTLSAYLSDQSVSTSSLSAFLQFGDNVDLSTPDITGSQLINLDFNDKYSLALYKKSVSIFISGTAINTSLVLDEYLSVISARFGVLQNPGLSTEADIINHFVTNYAYTDADEKVTKFLASKILERITIWYETSIDVGINDEMLEQLLAFEERLVSEETVEDEKNYEEDEAIYQVQRFFSLIYFGANDGTQVDPMEEFFQKTRKDEITEKNVRATSRVFGIDIKNLLNTSEEETLARSIYSRLESTGLIYLASYAYEIGEFAKKRLQNIATVKKSANDFIDPSVDTPWLQQLSQVVYSLQQDPISFSIINHYFPSLLTFVFDAIAVVGDYSNNGKGGGQEDTLNNMADAILSLEKAFGVSQSGKPIFTLAGTEKFYTTSERIKKALQDFPFRANIPPRKPDIFHLRLGAANFYVPPVSVSVNSAFKTGSLTGGAIRQRNTPKFNAGYKETTVSLRLFFPNYEEIWGLSIDDASSLDLNENFTIDFKNGGDSEDKIDKFLSSLRGLIAAFKYSPILPIKNQYINSVHGITAVALSAMSISTIPSYPFALVVDLELYSYNHKPFLPMIKDFNQAIHWGKYRQYMGKAAGEMHRYVSEAFLLKTSDDKATNQADTYEVSPYGAMPVDTTDEDGILAENLEYVNTYDNDVLSTNIVTQWKDGSNLTLFVPAETQTKIFLPDSTSFRSEQEKILNETSSGLWDRILENFGIDRTSLTPLIKDINDISSLSLESTYPLSTKKFVRQAIDIMTAGTSTDDFREKVYAYKVQSFISENITRIDSEQASWLRNYPGENAIPSLHFNQYPTIGSESYYRNNEIVKNPEGDNASLNYIKYSIYNESSASGSIVDELVNQEVLRQQKSTGITEVDQDKIRQQITDAFQVNLYERFFKDGFVKNLMEAVRLREGDYHFNEWEVPMTRVDLNPKEAIVNGVSVTMGNNLAKLQVQMQDEPTYQFIGGKDTYINISLTVFGEKELIKIKNIFDHANGLARLEHSTGVIGFLGIKNIISALAGVKYVLPLNYRVDTIPNYPHVYSVQLSFVDFDIFQQKREKISSDQQTKLIEHFGTKRNPFLRIKQMWGSFNAYPDLPLSIKDKDGGVVGNLDPDFYFRSFSMFDSDIINNTKIQLDLTEKFEFDNSDDWALGTSDNLERKIQSVRNTILDFITRYSYTNANNQDAREQRALTNEQLINEMIDYVQSTGISVHNFVSIFQDVVSANTEGQSSVRKQALLTDFIFLSASSSEDLQIFEDINGAPYLVGNVGVTNTSTEDLIKYILANSHLENETQVSFDPDEVEFHKVITIIPGMDPEEQNPNEIPAFMQTALGTHFGYINKENGRFYLTIDGSNVTIENDENSSNGTKIKLQSNFVEDTQTPDRGCTNSLTGVAGVSSLNQYQQAYSGDFNGHMEKMLNDIQYRDISGRMLRAFPTYMLWLIDEGGMFAGVKLFDNFYGLQSIVDFSVVSSEDLLGDTLILRMSNMYSKLTTRPSTEIFNANNDEFSNDPLNLTDGISAILDRTLNVARNIISGMRNNYVVDINNIRLKPGVRVHLRCGYGANPNSLQTVFNGVITNVEQGEIVTITAQSDAIELGAVVNSTNKKGDTGKIDGGVDTGMYLSEPRDLMVRLLSMGASRFKEAYARATNGTVFSENRFGIRHFGTMLYEPLNDIERARADGIRQTVAGVYNNLSELNIGGAANSAAFRISNVFSRDPVSGLFGNGSLMTSMGQLVSNYCSDVDLELFKRNIYPGNGTGFAQFLGGDLDDGWSTASSFSQDSTDSLRLAGQRYIESATDRSWNRLIVEAELGSTASTQTIENLVEDNKLVSAEGRAGLVAGVLKGAATIGLAALNPVAGAVAGAGLFGLLRGRGGNNLFRTMGIISPNADDDLQGFDEVSFRAQTYMRTVWDLFQTCARLLPNYIVAVRPFEDRSTIFYGKPHWLYTSGVVPVTTGFPSDEKAAQLNLPGYPKIVQPNNDIENIINQVSSQTNSLADYEAFKRSTELSDVISDLVQDQVNSRGIYAPTASVNGRLINFNSNLASSYSERNENGVYNVVCKLPVNVGKVRMGFHLPVGDPTKTFADRGNDNAQGHAQIDNLPIRFRYPFYTVNENVILNKYSTEIRDGGLLEGTYIDLRADTQGFPVSLKVGSVEIATDDLIDRYVEDGDTVKTGVSGGLEFTKGILALMQEEINFIKENSITIIPSSEITYELDRPLGLASLTDQLNLGEQSLFGEINIVRMPLPSVSIFASGGENDIGALTVTTIDAAENADDYSFEYELNEQISYQEWGSPKGLLEEQFYIAMKWPYKPGSSDKLIQGESLEKFKEQYGFVNLYGTAEDYKNRKVLVFSPLTQRAVVCAPAYFMWGEDSDEDVAAVVSPDAAWYLGSLVSSLVDKVPDELKNNLPNWASIGSTESEDVSINFKHSGGDSRNPLYTLEESSGIAIQPRLVDCFFAFVPDDVPVGVVSSELAPVKRFLVGDDKAVNEEYIIGFGNYTATNGETLTAQRKQLTGSADSLERQLAESSGIFAEWSASNASISDIDYTYGGNVLKSGDDLGYFEAILDITKISNDTDVLSRSTLYDRLDGELYTTGDDDTGSGRVGFAPVYSMMDSVSVEARSFYDENFDPNVSVIAGNGRTLSQANDIWDQFRFGYHTYESVKNIFAKTYGLDPDDTTEFPEEFKRILDKTNSKIFSNFSDNTVDVPGLENVGNIENTGVDELVILLGADFFTDSNRQGTQQGTSQLEARKQTIEFIRTNYIDATSQGISGDAGVIEYFNNVISKSLDNIRVNFFENQIINNLLQYSIENTDNQSEAIKLSDQIKTPKQLFLLMVGLFRQKLWSTAYGRAWLVLKPDRKKGPFGNGKGSEGSWSFKPVDKVFEAFISPYSQYAKGSEKFLQLLVSTASEGSNSSTWIGGIGEDVSDFYQRNIGPIFTAIGDGLSGLLGMFKLNMMQMGYAISEVGNFGKQAHILNKVLNDSIYYSLGRPGTLLRAVDNPFTREYGEPVLEVRQPFQRLHYVSSFSHIISNQIQENLNNVATVVTAVSDGKHPVTVALDKGAPPERQTEITVETGIYYDNMIGSGFLGVLHPLMHPLETFRGVAKNAQGTPDELSARRIALAHLKESIKDIYGGELIIIGNADIRPHDLVYLSDVYERMYGLFEVEQVVHHFTPEMGYITSITPNALVTVNDPSRWFLSSWLRSWLGLQNIRNDTRFYIDNIMASNTGINVGGDISVDALSDALMPQMMGGIEYTHGSTSLVKDIMANQTALTLPQKAQQLIDANKSGSDTGFKAVAGGLIAGSGLIAAAAGGAAAAIALPIVGQLAWKGWKWIRDNVLDQHGCYIQYLNKNGQPMDAGLSYNQGMVVGRYHSKALLPGLLGARTKVKTPEGNVFIRSDDLLKSLGWQEVEIKDLVRHIDYENAITHARVLQLSGLGPEKADLQPSLFRVIVKVTEFIDGDTFWVQDIISGSTFKVRFDGINTGETNTIRVGGIPNEPGNQDNQTQLTSISTPGGRAKLYTEEKLKNRIFVLRTKISNSATDDVIFEQQFQPGANENTVANYAKDVTASERVLGTIWYYQPESVVQQAEQFVTSCFIKNKEKNIGSVDSINNLICLEFFKGIYEDSPMNVKKLSIYNEIINSKLSYFAPEYLRDNAQTNYGISEDDVVKLYNALVAYRILNATYEKTSEWPTIFWDEYYEDGYPVTLNWELVSNNLAQVYAKQVQIESESVISAEESALMPRRVI
jgi:hypothetical protein